MVHNAGSSRYRHLEMWRRPWFVMLSGLGATILGIMLLSVSAAPAAVVVGIVLLGSGAIAAAAAVRLRLKDLGPELDQRVEAASLVAAAAFVALLAFFGMGEWDSARLFFGGLIAVGLVGAGLVLLPSPARRFALSVLVLLHFGGIFVAITAVEPAGQQAPWLSVQAWIRFYRPYLQSMYLINAYHFYSPDPGPANLLWFCVRYEDDSLRWLKIPNRNESPVPMHYQRMLALTESTNSLNPRPPLTEDEIRLELQRLRGAMPIPRSQEEIQRKRMAAGQHFLPKPIPWLPLPMSMQYAEPQPYSRMMLSSYARYVAHHFPHELDPSVPVKSMKIYRVQHAIVSPAELAEGRSPIDPRQYRAFYQGEYDPEGNLKDPDSPFLYWLLPMMYVPKGYPEVPLSADVPMSQMELLDCVKMHAEYKPFEPKNQ
jgi:hypothetical protein